MKLRQLTPIEIANVEALHWWHRTPIGYSAPGKVYYTPGIVDHGVPGDYEHSRFGVPKNLKGKTVLDIGGYNGHFSFVSEKCGAERVCMVDYFQGTDATGDDGYKAFLLATSILESKVEFYQNWLNTGTVPDIQRAFQQSQFDFVYLFGVLYHTPTPLDLLQACFALTAPGGTCLVETAVYQLFPGMSLVAFLPGHEGDPTNLFYPTVAALESMLRRVGFTHIETFYDMGPRVTTRAKKE